MVEQAKTKQSEQKKQSDTSQTHKGDGGSLMAQRPRHLMPLRGGEPFGRLRQEFERVFDRFFGSRLMPWQDGGQEWSLGLDVEETDQAVIVAMEAPGFEPRDFDIQLRGDTLTVSAMCKSESEQVPGMHEWHREEFCRTVDLPAAVNIERCEAHYRNGILRITLPRAEQTPTQRIEVKG